MDVTIPVAEIVAALETAEDLEIVAVSAALVAGGYGLYYYSSSLDGEEMDMVMVEIMDMAMEILI